MAFDLEKDRWNREAVTKEQNRTAALSKAMQLEGERAMEFQRQAKTSPGMTGTASLVGDFAQWAVGEKQKRSADEGLAKARAQQGSIDAIAGNLLTAKQEQDATQVFAKDSKMLYRLTQRMDGVMGKLAKYADGGELEGQEPPGISGAHLADNGQIAVFSSADARAHLAAKAGIGVAGAQGGAGAGQVGGMLGSTVGKMGDVHSQGNEEAQLLKSEITGLINDLVREQSGASATDTERRSVALSMGFNEWSDTNVMLNNLNSLQGKLKGRINQLGTTTHEQVLDSIARRGADKDIARLTDWTPTEYSFANYGQGKRKLGESLGDAFDNVAGAGVQEKAHNAVGGVIETIEDGVQAAAAAGGELAGQGSDYVQSPDARQDVGAGLIKAGEAARKGGNAIRAGLTKAREVAGEGIDAGRQRVDEVNALIEEKKTALKKWQAKKRKESIDRTLNRPPGAPQ